MGLFPAPTKCIFTGLKTTDMPTSLDGIEYFIELGDRKQGFTISRSENWTDNEFLNKHRHICKSLIFSNKWDLPFNTYITDEVLKEYLSTKNYPKTPGEKYEYFFLELFYMQEYEGQDIDLPNGIEDNYFFKNEEEFRFYLNSYENAGLINLTQTNTSNSVQLTFDGLNYALKLETEGEHSNRCFIAMSFSESVNDIRQTIKKVCEDLGYQAILIDEIHLDSAQTINDGIIAEIRKSKFMCADFTEQKDGVYFESGYALGQSKKVIYSCRDDWFDKSHFDTNHFPHIIYKNTDELYDKLKTKIEAWVK